MCVEALGDEVGENVLRRSTGDIGFVAVRSGAQSWERKSDYGH